MIRWLRVVLPPAWALVMTALLLGGILAFILFQEWIRSISFLTLAREILPGFMTIVAAGYAAYRICTFHPVLRPGYFDWLQVTPWTSRQSLPLGPVHLVVQDLVVLGAAVGVAWPIMDWRSLYLLQAFLTVYLLGLAWVLYLTGEKLWSYALAFGVGWIVLFWFNAGVFYSNAAVLYGMALEALRRSLARFPWDDITTVRDFHLLLRRSVEPRKRAQAALGWPYERMGPDFSDFVAGGAAWISRLDVLFFGLLSGWAFYVVEVAIPRTPSRSLDVDFVGTYFTCGMFLTFLIAGRLAAYCDGYLPPLSLLGRLAHLQPIIPGYDIVFVAPLLSLIVAVAAWYVPQWTTADRTITIAAAICVNVWILFGMGPSLKSWRLTGNHRITRGIFQKDVVRTG